MQIKTKDLVIEVLKEEDLDPIWNYRNDDSIANYQSQEHYAKEYAIYFLRKENPIKLPDTKGIWYLMSIKKSDEIIGDCAMRSLLENPNQMEISIVMSKKYRHKGYAKQALHSLFDYIFNSLEKHRIIANTDADNLDGCKLLESLNMRKEGHFVKSIWFRGSWKDEFSYAILKNEFK